MKDSKKGKDREMRDGGIGESGRYAGSEGR